MIVEAIICGIISSLGTATITLAVIKNDVRWIREKLGEMSERLLHLEREKT